MVTARRDLLKILGGSAAAVAFTPVPWRTLDDISIWTQNWSWIPRPVRGEITYKPAACTLCPLGCAARVRCSGAQPVAMLPAADSALCAYGLAAHQMPYHPGRIRQPNHPVADALAALKQAMAAGRTIALIDSWPGRVASSMYSRFAAATKNGLYLTATAASNTGPDLRRARTLVSFGVPVLEDWGPPGLLLRRRDEVRIIYVGRKFTLTAEMSDRWVPTFTDDMLAELKEHGPAVAIGDGPEAARINQLLGARAALVRRREATHRATEVSSIPDSSIGLVVAETPSISLDVLRPKLASDAVIIAFAGWPNEYTAGAKYVLPLPAPLETIEDVPASFDAPVASFRLTPALIPNPVLTLADFLAQAMPALGSLEQNRNARITAIHKEARGTVDGKPVRGMKLEDFSAALTAGAVWMDEEAGTVSTSGGPTAPERRQLLTPRPLLAGRLMKRYGLVIDLDRCNGCGACAVACAVENNVPPPLPRETERTSITPMRVYRMTSGTQTAFIPVMCQQCGEHPPCATVCPQQAVEVDTETGIVLQMPQRCLGCRYCMTACPYHARYFNWSDPEWPAGMERTLNPDVAPRMRGVVEKCNFCHGRLQATRAKIASSGSKDIEAVDYTPACAEACPSRAIQFVDLQTARPEGVRMLERIGTEPKVYYKSKRPWVQAKLAAEVKRG